MCVSFCIRKGHVITSAVGACVKGCTKDVVWSCRIPLELVVDTAISFDLGEGTSGLSVPLGAFPVLTFPAKVVQRVIFFVSMGTTTIICACVVRHGYITLCLAVLLTAVVHGVLLLMDTGIPAAVSSVINVFFLVALFPHGILCSVFRVVVNLLLPAASVVVDSFRMCLVFSFFTETCESSVARILLLRRPAVGNASVFTGLRRLRDFRLRICFAVDATVWRRARIVTRFVFSRPRIAIRRPSDTSLLLLRVNPSGSMVDGLWPCNPICNLGKRSTRYAALTRAVVPSVASTELLNHIDLVGRVVS